MKIRAGFAWGVMFACFSTAWAVDFKSAYPAAADADGAASSVSFEAFQSVDWRASAPGWMKAFDASQESRRVVDDLRAQMDAAHNADIPFPVAMPADFEDSAYYLLSGKGIMELKVTGLSGIGRFKFSAVDDIFIGPMSQITVDNPVYFGQVTAAPVKGGAVESGFAVRLPKAIAPVRREFTAEERFEVVVNEGSATYSYTRPGREPVSLTAGRGAKVAHPAAMLHKYIVDIDGAAYIVVQWASPETRPGSSEYMLFEAGSSLRLVAKTGYSLK